MDINFNHKEGTGKEIGIIDFGITLVENKVIGKQDLNLSGLGKCTVEIYDDEGNYIPHFHISNKVNKPDTCVYIFDNKFFKHGNHKGSLINKECRELNKWLESSNKKNSNLNNWEVIRQEWFNSHPKDIEKYKDIKKPDYSTMKYYKDM